MKRTRQEEFLFAQLQAYFTSVRYFSHAVTICYRSNTKCPDAVMNGGKREPQLPSVNPSINKSELLASDLQEGKIETQRPAAMDGMLCCRMGI